MDRSELSDATAPSVDATPSTVTPSGVVRYERPRAHAGSPAVKRLVALAGSNASSASFEFFDQIEIGRDDDDRESAPGLLLVRASHVSARHCIITQNAQGRCFVRDVSRNGSRVNGRRLMPNVESEIQVGQTLDIGGGIQFALEGEAPVATAPETPRKRTSVARQLTLATVLIGDIRDYTVMVREAPAATLQQSVRQVFQHLTVSVEELGGTIKEFPGDAILAFWEGDLGGAQAVAACSAAIRLDRLVRRIAADSSLWALPDWPLRMDWALASGGVVIDSFGGDAPVGLSMVGEPIVLAARLEKFASDQTGRVLTCPATRRMVMQATQGRPGESLTFVDLGPMQAKGFDRPDHVFALQLPNDA